MTACTLKCLRPTLLRYEGDAMNEAEFLRDIQGKGWTEKIAGLFTPSCGKCPFAVHGTCIGLAHNVVELWASPNEKKWYCSESPPHMKKEQQEAKE